jgi:ubiquinol-cytochrome c reductase iron-sulfur subunit
MSIEEGRRKFFGFALGGFAAIGGVASLVAIKKAWDPLPSVQAAGFTTVDISPINDGEIRTVEWRGMPVFILKKTDDMSSEEKRDVVIDGSRYTVVIGLCTHLGCIPSWNANKKEFLCACHGGSFDASGLVVLAPPPRPLDIPPFKIDGTTLVLGEEGPEYKELVAKA